MNKVCAPEMKSDQTTLPFILGDLSTEHVLVQQERITVIIPHMTDLSGRNYQEGCLQIFNASKINIYIYVYIFPPLQESQREESLQCHRVYTACSSYCSRKSLHTFS